MVETLTVREPSYGTPKSVEGRPLIADFGDGYEQRGADGNNDVRETWNPVWNRMPVAEADALEAFIRARRYYEAFLWTPPRAATPLKFRCDAKSFKRVPDRTMGGHDTVSATFIQVFDL